MPKGLVKNSTRMQVAARLMAETISKGDVAKKTQGEILKEAGYAKSLVANPSHITRTKSFQALLEKYLPMNKIVQRHAELIESQTENVALNAVTLGYRVQGVVLDRSQHAHAVAHGVVTTGWVEQSPQNLLTEGEHDQNLQDESKNPQ